MLNQTPPCDLRGGVMGSFLRIFFFFCVYFGLGTKSFVFQAFPLLWTFPHILIPQIHSAIYLQEFADICESLYWRYYYHSFYWDDDDYSVAGIAGTQQVNHNSCGLRQVVVYSYFLGGACQVTAGHRFLPFQTQYCSVWMRSVRR